MTLKGRISINIGRIHINDTVMERQYHCEQLSYLKLVNQTDIDAVMASEPKKAPGQERVKYRQPNFDTALSYSDQL